MTNLDPESGWTIDEWRDAFISGALSLHSFQEWHRRIDAADPAWIHLAPWDEVAARLQALLELIRSGGESASTLPLCGVPFAVKDNIDVGGWPTTAACPAFSYVAERDATVVAQLKKAGAIVIGKTNLDQFATGLVGTRTPYGVVTSAFRENYLAGGSSSGSASLVTRGVVPFTLGTDTAGSGRVPAAFGNIVGLKPTRGLFSTRGVVPACRTLDCVSIFAHTVSDAARVAEVLSHFDPKDPYSRSRIEHHRTPSSLPRVGVLEPLEFFGDAEAERAYRESLERLETDGFELRPVDSRPFFELAELLYAGPWVAERALTAGSLVEQLPSKMDPVVLGILRPAGKLSAEDAFRYEYRRAELASSIQQSFRGLDATIVPTTPTTYTLEDVRREPIETNARLGTYTNFTNLADLCAVAVPARFRRDGLPTGLTFLGPAMSDQLLLPLADRAHRLMDVPMGATKRPLPPNEVSGRSPTSSDSKTTRVKVAVVGAHLSNMPLNHQLTDRGAHLVSSTTTASRYRLFLLPGSKPLKPGLLRVAHGVSIVVEVWEMSHHAFGEFTAEVPPPLGIGSVELVDSTWVKGFICEPYALEGAQEISSFGGFSAYLAAASTA